MPASDKLLTPEEARARTHTSRSGFYRVVRPYLPAVKMSARTVRFRESDVEAFIVSRTESINAE